MLQAMLFAHLLGDYLFQWDSLAIWKSKQYSGVALHGLIVTLTHLSVTIIVDPSWWLESVFIGIIHTLIDAFPVWMLYRGIKTPLLPKFILDQIAHLATIIILLQLSNYNQSPSAAQVAATYTNKFWLFLLAYVFLTKPAWVLIEFCTRSVDHKFPNFSQAPSLLGTSIERILTALLVSTNQWFLIPLILLPRIALEKILPDRVANKNAYYLEWTVGILIAILVGIVLRKL